MEAAPAATATATATATTKTTSITASSPSTADYWIGPLIGEGAFAQVHFAKHKQWKNQSVVAIKVIDQATIRKYPTLLPSLFEERRLLSTTLRDISSVIRLWSSFYDSQCLYFVMELCEGGDLQEVLNWQFGKQQQQQQQQQQHAADTSTDNPDTPSMKYWLASIPLYLAQIQEGVSALHAHNIVHCDLKPANILLTLDGRTIKLADFGSALDVSSLSSSSSSSSSSSKDANTNDRARSGSSLRGTAEYAPPELIRNQEQDLLLPPPACPTTEDALEDTADVWRQERQQALFAMDYWSFGCVAIALYTGKSPFWREGSEALTIQSIMEYAAKDNNNDDGDGKDSFWEELLLRVDKHDPSDGDPTPGRNNSTPLDDYRGLLHVEPRTRWKSWKRSLPIPRSVNASSEEDEEKGLVLPPPKWKEQVEGSELKDGALGWGVFFL